MEFILKSQNDILKVQNELMTVLPSLKEKPFVCEIKPYKEKRSLDANAYFHFLVEKIAKEVGIGAEECKRNLNLDYGTMELEADGQPRFIFERKGCDPLRTHKYPKWICDRKLNGFELDVYIAYKHTHKLDSKEMAQLIDGTILEAKELGIATLTPIELEAFKGYKKEK